MVWRSVSVTTAQVVMEEHQSVKVRGLYTAVGLIIIKTNSFVMVVILIGKL